MFCTVPPCPLCLPQPLLWPRRPGSGHGTSGQGGSRRSCGGALVPVVGLVQVAAVLLLLPLEVGAALLLAVGAALLGGGSAAAAAGGGR